jgi:hypothetical protein
MFKALWNGDKPYTANYPLVGPKSTGTANLVVDLVKQGLKDTVDTFSIHLIGSIVTGAGALGTATGAENPQGLVTLSRLTTAPQAAGLTPVNALSSRAVVVDQAIVQGAFDTVPAIANVASGTIPLDTWLHFRFKRPGVKKAIEYAHPMKKWNSDLLTLTCGTVDQLFTGAATTWDMTGVSIEIFADVDVDANPENIHAVELFELLIPVTSANPALIINQLPQGCFYDNLFLVAEDTTTATGVTALSDTLIQNISIQGGGRTWLQEGQNNASFIRQRYTKPLFFDPNGGAHGLTGIYVLPLRDGLWSRAIDATSTPIILKLAVLQGAGGFVAGHTYNIRVCGRKIVPGGIKKTVKGASGQHTVVGLPDA